MDVCPCNVIGISENDELYFIPERESICQRCGQCMAVCNTKSIIVDGFGYDSDFTDLPRNNVDYNAFIDFLANRRSIRNFKDKAVPKEIIEKVLEALSFAPYGAEPEKIQITVVNDRKQIESALPYIENFLDNIVKWIEHPIASRMMKRRNIPEKFNTVKNHLYPIAKLGNYKLEEGDRITRNAPAIIILHARKDAEEHTNNSMIYATYMMLAAHSLGLGATLIGLVPPSINKVREVREIFQVPYENEAVMSLILGYPKIKYRRTIVRKRHAEWLS
jgi:nitroreductase